MRPLDMALAVITILTGSLGLVWISVTITAAAAADDFNGINFVRASLGGFILMGAAAVLLVMLRARER